jgi:glycosyltransferase involved in cell wall biosynthesis
MNIHLLYPVLPPVVDGIGDYTRCLAMTLADQGPVTIWSNQHEYAAIERVTVRSACEIDRPRRMGPLVEAVVGKAPDWLVVQYNPFSYGKWGFNPALPAALRNIRKAGVRLALMVHEPYVPFTDWRSVVMGSWHRWQLRALIASSDVVFFSIAPWTEEFRGKLPHKRVEHLPVGSNIPNIHAPRHVARQALGIEDDVLVAGVFGSAHPSRRIGYVKRAIDAIRDRHPKIRVLSIGTAGQVLREQLDPSIALTDTGVLAAAAVSAHFSAMDLYLTPFRRGVSTRRGSFLVGLQHGIATLSTAGEHTDAMLSDQAGNAFLLTEDGDIEAFARQAVALVEDSDFRNRVALEGQAFFERRLSWPHIATQLVQVLRETDARTKSPRILTESAL